MKQNTNDTKIQLKICYFLLEKYHTNITTSYHEVMINTALIKTARMTESELSNNLIHLKNLGIIKINLIKPIVVKSNQNDKRTYHIAFSNIAKLKKHISKLDVENKQALNQVTQLQQTNITQNIINIKQTTEDKINTNRIVLILNKKNGLHKKSDPEKKYKMSATKGPYKILTHLLNCTNKEDSISNLTIFFNPPQNEQVSRAVYELNKRFKKHLGYNEPVITHPYTGAYAINTEIFKIINEVS